MTARGASLGDQRVRGPLWLQAVVALAAAKIVCALAGVFLPEAAPRPFPAWTNGANIAAFAASGVLLLVGGRGDARARWLGAHFLAFATMFGDRFLARMGAVDGGSLLVLLTSLRPDALGPALLWRFAERFPSTGPSYGTVRHLVAGVRRTVTLLGVVLFAASLAVPAGFVSGPLEGVLGALAWGVPGSHYWTVLVLCTLPALPFIIRKTRAASVDERRRVRLFASALIAGSLPMLAELLLETFVPSYGRLMSRPDARLASGLVVYPFLLAIPFATGYAVLVDQALDVRLVVRKALQYALVRYFVVVLLAVPLVVTVSFFYRRRALPLGQALSGGGIVMLAGSALASALGLRYSRRWFNAIDRRFFREQYDAQQILGSLISSSRRAGTPQELAALLMSQIERALHLDRIALLALNEGSGVFASADGSVRPIPVGAQLALLAGGSADPLDLDLRNEALRRLPPAEREWIADSGFVLLVPLLGSNGGLTAILALGQKLSDLPFSADDRRLLSDVSASAAVALENLAMRVSPGRGDLPPGVGTSPQAAFSAGDEAAWECSGCQLVHPSQLPACPACGAPLMRAPVPHVLLGKFRFDRRIGSGGMGVVYLALDLALHRRVAIKTLPRVSPEHSVRLRREARSMAAFTHPNLALILGAETWCGAPLLVFEYLEGGTLADRLRRPMLESEVVELGRRIADVLVRAHASGFLHRDIKPSNIGFTMDGAPKLLDFGLVKIVGDTAAPLLAATAHQVSNQPTATWPAALAAGSTGQHGFIGTAIYLSPETVSGAAPDPSVDLWALAAVLYECVTGLSPFAGPTLLDTLNRIARAEVPAVRSLAPQCSTELAGFLESALARDRASRPASALEFRRRLDVIASRMSH